MIILSSREFLLQHIASLRQKVTVGHAGDRDNLDRLEEELHALAARHKTLSIIRGIVFVFLYASFVSNFALPAVTEIVKTFTLVANLLGVGILSLATLYLTWRLGQLWNRMTVIGSHVIAIYEKHNGDQLISSQTKKTVSRKRTKRS